MEDYNSNLLNDSKNEWSIRLMNILSGHIIDGFRSIFNEAIEICEQNEEPEKYLMTFQNFLSRIPKWNQSIIENETKRIIENSKCNYLEDLVSCVHIIQLKILSCVRTSNHNKRIEIDIPNINTFLHHVYINIARKLYSNIYLFQIDNTSLEQQKNNREFEIIVQTCIMNTIRDNIPIDQLLKQYIDETQELDIERKANIIKNSDTSPPPNNIPLRDVSNSATSVTGLEDTKSEGIEKPDLSTTDIKMSESNISTPVSNVSINDKNTGVYFSESAEEFDPLTKVKTEVPLVEAETKPADDFDQSINKPITILDTEDEIPVSFELLDTTKHNVESDSSPFQILGDSLLDVETLSEGENESLRNKNHEFGENEIIDLGATELDL